MNLHITPSFNIDRLCKTASVLLFLVICEYYNVVAVTQTAAHLAQLGRAASIVGKSESWFRNTARPLFFAPQ